jgi:hypothetical protein
MAIQFDEQLKSRLLAFQKAHGLTEDGTVGAHTWTKLVDPAGDVDTGTPDKAAAVQVAVTPDNFPLLFKIAETCQDEQGFKNFLLEEAGVDIDAVVADIQSVLDALDSAPEEVGAQ